MSKEIEKVTKKMVKEAVKPVEHSSKTLVYCGPSIKSLQQYSVFKGELPDYLNKIIEEFPLIKSLFVSPIYLSRFREQLKIKGTKEHQLFTVLAKQMKERSGNV